MHITLLNLPLNQTFLPVPFKFEVLSNLALTVTFVPPLQPSSSMEDIMRSVTITIFNVVKIVFTNDLKTVCSYASSRSVAKESSGGTLSVRPSAPSYQPPNPLPVVIIEIPPLLS